jgi:hypothetical protein
MTDWYGDIGRASNGNLQTLREENAHCEFCGGPHNDGHMDEWMIYTEKLLDLVDEIYLENYHLKALLKNEL